MANLRFTPQLGKIDNEDGALRLFGDEFEVLNLNSVASSVNFFEVLASATTGPVIFRAAGTDTNITINVTPKGSGSLALSSHKITGVSDGTATGDALHFGQIGAQVQAFDSDLSALAAIATTGLYVITGAGTSTTRTLTTTAGHLVITNGNGVSGNPLLDLASVGTPVSASFVKITTDAQGRVSATTAVVAADGAVFDSRFLNVDGDAMTAGFLTLFQDPTSALHAVTKQYVDNVATGLIDAKQSVRVATAAALPANTQAGTGVGATLTANAVGVLTVDGVATVLNNRILVKDEAAGDNNGIYKVTTEGTAGVAYVLTRAIDADQDTEVTAGLYTFVEEGTANADSGWILTTNNPITVDTTSLTFVQFTGLGQITAGAGLTKTGNVLDVGGTTNRITVGADSVDISSAYVGQTSITTLGTITTGVWNGTTIAIANGGTGQTTATAAFNALDPLTTKGDLIVHDGTNSIREAVGANNFVLTADSAQASGIKWAVAPVSSVTLTEPAAGIDITNSGVAQTGAVSFTFALINDLSALEGLSGTGIAVRSASDTWVQRTIVSTSSGLVVTNGDGVSGNPSLALDADLQAFSALTPVIGDLLYYNGAAWVDTIYSKLREATVQTTTAASTEIINVAIASGSAGTFTVHAHGVQNTGTNVFAIVISGAIVNIGGVTTIVGSSTETVFTVGTVTGWDVNAVADDTNDTLDINVVGAAATTIDWKVRVDLVIG